MGPGGRNGVAPRPVPLAEAVDAKMSGDAVKEWARRARPGEVLVYYSGAFLVKAMPAVRAADALIAAGEVIPIQKKLGPGRYDYSIQKRRNAERQLSAGALGGSATARRVGVAVDGEELERLMAVLRRLANFRLPCPVNAELARLAQLKDAEAARYRLKLAEEQGLIRVRVPTPGAQRVVTIIASGRSTARC